LVVFGHSFLATLDGDLVRVLKNILIKPSKKLKNRKLLGELIALWGNPLWGSYCGEFTVV